MIDSMLSLVAPHICVGCGAASGMLCECCFFDIISNKWCKCIACNQQMTTTVFVKNGNMCHECNKNLPFDKVFIVGARSGSLQKLVGDYKYFSQYEGAKQIASLLNQILPEDLPSDLVIVPLTTIPKHVRQRGFDHMKLVAKNLAKIRKLRVCSILRRTNNLSQHVASGSQRRENAKSAILCQPKYRSPENNFINRRYIYDWCYYASGGKVAERTRRQPNLAGRRSSSDRVMIKSNYLLY